MKLAQNEMKLLVNMLSKESELVIAKLSFILDFIFTILCGNLVVLGLDNIKFIYLIVLAAILDVLLIAFTIWLIVLIGKHNSEYSSAILFNGLILTKIGVMFALISLLLCIESKDINLFLTLISTTVIAVVVAVFLFVKRIRIVKTGKIKKDSFLKWIPILVPIVILSRNIATINFDERFLKDIRLAFWLTLGAIFVGFLLGTIELYRYYIYKKYTIEQEKSHSPHDEFT